MRSNDLPTEIATEIVKWKNWNAMSVRRPSELPHIRKERINQLWYKIEFTLRRIGKDGTSWWNEDEMAAWCVLVTFSWKRWRGSEIFKKFKPQILFDWKVRRVWRETRIKENTNGQKLATELTTELAPWIKKRVKYETIEITSTLRVELRACLKEGKRHNIGSERGLLTVGKGEELLACPGGLTAPEQAQRRHLEHPRGQIAGLNKHWAAYNFKCKSNLLPGKRVDKQMSHP